MSIHGSGSIKVVSVSSNTDAWEIVGIAIEDAASGGIVSVCTSGFTTGRTETKKQNGTATLGARLYMDTTNYSRVTETAGQGAIAVGYVAAESTADDGIFMRFQK